MKGAKAQQQNRATALFLQEYATKMANYTQMWLLYYSAWYDHNPPAFQVTSIDMPGESNIQRVHLIIPNEEGTRVELNPTSQERLAVAEECAEFSSILRRVGIPKEVRPEDICLVESVNRLAISITFATKESLGLDGIKSVADAIRFAQSIKQTYQQYLDHEVEAPADNEDSEN